MVHSSQNIQFVDRIIYNYFIAISKILYLISTCPSAIERVVVAVVIVDESEGVVRVFGGEAVGIGKRQSTRGIYRFAAESIVEARYAFRPERACHGFVRDRSARVIKDCRRSRCVGYVCFAPHRVVVYHNRRRRVGIINPADIAPSIVGVFPDNFVATSISLSFLSSLDHISFCRV